MMKHLDDTIKNEQYKKKLIQRSIQVPADIWEASKCIPGGRTKFIIDSLAGGIDAYKSELPKLRMEVEELNIEIRSKEALRSAKLSRIAELEAEVEVTLQEAVKVQQNIEQAIVETSRLLKTFRRDITKSHFNRLAELSKTPAEDIEIFIIEYKYRPTEEQVREFFLR
jgi:hypothetical protein